MLKEHKIKRNQTILKLFGTEGHYKLKLIQMDCVRNSGIETEEEEHETIVRGTVNDEKLQENIIRARTKIFELAFCNPWDWFFTGTLNKDKHDRTDLVLFHKRFTQWLRDYNKKHDTAIKFLVVPELHSDGESWHMHGFLYGLPQEHLNKFMIGGKMSSYLAAKVSHGEDIYNWTAYENKFGYCDLEPVKNPEAACRYITKYITKDLSHNVTELNAQMYYHSRGLKFAEVIKKGYFDKDIDFEPSFSGDYCNVYWLDYDEEMLKYLEEGFVKAS